MAQGGLAPAELARAFREEFPGLYDDLDDAELISAIRDEDPDTYDLLDPVLKGAELLAPFRTAPPPPPPLRTGGPADPTKPYPLPTPTRQPSWSDIAITTGLRVAPAVAGGIGGFALGGPPGMYAGGAGGAGMGETAAQTYERSTGIREDLDPRTIAFETALGAVNPAARASTTLGRVGLSTAYGAGLSGVGGAGRSLIETGGLPDPQTALLQAAAGAAFGAATQGAAEGINTLYRLRRSSAGEAPRDLPTLQEAKTYLDELAALQAVPIPIPEIQPGLTASPYAAPPPRPQLPAQAGLAQPPRETIRAYPPGAQPNVELVGALAPPPSRVVGGRDVGGAGVPPPPTFEQALEASLQAPPGAPRLRPRALELTPPPVPRETLGPPPLLGQPLRSPEGPIEQGARMGGRRHTAEQPRIPKIEEGVPLDRTYATGPNAGPRRRGELHGKPRQAVRYVEVAGERRRELYDSPLPAEDPATYPPEVRRELAAMAWELEQFPHERIGGGYTRGMEAAGLSPGEARKRGVTAGGAIAGAPVYHDVIKAAQGGFAHVKRAEMLRHLRAALLEGKGTGLTDAAAQVARRRLEARAAGMPRGSRIRATRGDEGDALIGWVDEAGARALPEQELDEFARAAREADDGELLSADRAYRRGEFSEATEPYFLAAQTEAARRGLIQPTQPGLTMEGPGGSRGPSLFDFDEEPPVPGRGAGEAPPAAAGTAEVAPEIGPPPTLSQAERNAQARAEAAAEGPARLQPQWIEAGRTLERRVRAGTGPGGIERRRAEAAAPVTAPPPSRPLEQPALPGAEGVRLREIPTPEVAELPFSLTPPPSKPEAPQQPSLLRKLLEREEGVLILDIPAGDRTGLRRWLQRQEAEHGGEAWYNRVEQAMSEGDWDRAWKAAASASVRSYARAYGEAKTPAEQARLARAVRGTPLQPDINTQIIAQARGRAGVTPPAPKVRDYPPSARVTQAGAARGRATVGPAGIISPGPPQRPLSSAQPSIRGGTVDRNVVKLILQATAAEGKATVPGNQDTMDRLFRQIGEDVYLGKNLRLLREAGVDIPSEELAQHFNNTISDWGRGLNLLKQFADAHPELTEAAEAMSMGGALRGMLGRGEAVRPTAGAGGRVIGAEAQARTAAVLAQDSTIYQQNMVANVLQRRKPVGILRALHDASYPWMLMRWSTAVRDYLSTQGRYTVDSLDHALTVPIAALAGDAESARLAREAVGARGFTMFQRGAAITPRRAWQENLQGIWDLTADSLASASPKDVRHAVRLLTDLPEGAAHFLGTMGGEDLRIATANVPVLRHLTNPKVQRVLSSFRRAQEFSGRAVVFDGALRALLRARDLDPDTLLRRPTAEIIEAVGGQNQFEDLVFTATSQALEATFAGQLAKDSLPAALVRFINSAWPLKLGVPFPRFNFSSAPRWIYDHGPWALAELVRWPLDAAGLTAPPGTAAGGRLYRGTRAQQIERKALPGIVAEIGAAERRQGAALRELLGTQREWQVRQRQVARLQSRVQPGLPGTPTSLQAAIEARDQLARRRERLKADMQQARQTVGDLKAEQRKLLDVLMDARGINAPNFAQYLARIGTGTVGMLGAAWVVRSQEGAQGTRWYEFRVDRGEGQDPIILDFRPFAPFAQYLFVADVLNDFQQHTNWPAYQAQLDAEGGDFKSPLDASRAIWNNYEGKYTAAELGAQFAQAFLSISRAAGTTLTVTDLMTQNGWPSPQEAVDAIIGTVGQFLSRFTVGAQQVKDVMGQFLPEEAKLRVPPRATVEDWERPLAAPFGNLPGAGRLIPERISQTTGQPVAAEFPLLRALAGIGTAPRDFIVEEVQRIGVPGQSVYIRETGDYGLDRLVAETYARLLREELPGFLEDPSYTELGTPARQRDYLQRYAFPTLKRAALAETRDLLGEERYEAATVRGEAARYRDRQQRLLDELEGDLPPLLETPAEPELGPPPGPPGSARPVVSAPPGFEAFGGF